MQPALAKAAPGAVPALVLLLSINLFNYIDRQVLSAVLPKILSDGTLFDARDVYLQTKGGLLTSAFMVAYMIVSPVVGWLDGHGYRRWIILGLGVTVWSLASGTSGFAASYATLLGMRCLIGVGEGAYGPVASALLADSFPPERRGVVMALFNMAIPIGSALGFVTGGLVLALGGNWRHAFFVTYAGLILGLLCFTRKELPRPELTEAEASQSYFDVLRHLAGVRSFVLCCAGMTAITFVIGGLAVWVPEYVTQRQSQYRLSGEVLSELADPKPDAGRPALPADVVEALRAKADGEARGKIPFKLHLAGALSREQEALYLSPVIEASTTPESPREGTVSIYFGVIIVLGGLTATAAGAWAGEYLRRRVRGAYFWIIGAGALLAVPCYVGLITLPFPFAWAAAYFTIFFLFLHTGPAFTVLANVVPSHMRATAFAINILVIHALGDVISPPIIGAIADATSLQTAFWFLTGVIALGGVLWCFGASGLEADTARAEGADGAG